jgi:hypothetical protein
VVADESLDEMIPTTVSLHHSSEYPTHVLLPVIPE